MTTLAILLAAPIVIGALVCGAWLWLRAAQPAPGEAPEDDGADWDAGIKHTCWQCGCRINGPEDGLRIPDRECWECYCSRNAPDDSPAVPNYVARRAAR